MSLWRSLGCVALGVALFAGAAQVRHLRHPGLVRALFGDAAPGAAPALARGEGPPLGRVDRVRVILIDGLDRHTAQTLPSVDSLCATGLDLVVDVGFPTVSLPVQHVLWTGLTQQQSGIQYRLTRVDPPPPHAIPAQVPNSVAVSEADVDLAAYGLPEKRGGPYQFIVHSFGFAETLPAAIDAAPSGWADGGFASAAAEAVAGDAPLAFIHVLRTDTVAHKKGRDSPEFQRAARWADDLVRQLAVDAAPPGTTTRWFVLADHGHIGPGGHGGSEPSIRQVRGCITGGVAPRTGGNLVHLIDVSRAIADSLGVKLHSGAVGRPLGAALDAPTEPDATLPRPGVGRWMLAALVLLLATALTAWAARGHLVALPWWLPVAYLSVVLLEGAPTLSMAMVYSPKGQAIQLAAWPGFAMLAVGIGVSLNRFPTWRIALAQLLLPAGMAVASLILCGGAHLLVGAAGDPPLMPRWTAHASVFLVLWGSAMLVAAVGALASAIPGNDDGAAASSRSAC